MLKVGDTVRIRKDLSEEMKIDFGVISPMVELAGSTQEVMRIFGDCVLLKNVLWTWHKDMFETIPTQSIHITTDGTTVHAVQNEGGKVTKRAKAVCSPTDTFDFEVGAKLAMERLWGSGAREVKRPARVGEWVKVTNTGGCSCDEYRKGDILQIVEYNYGNPSGAYYRNARLKYLDVREYVVLENYTPPKAEPPKSEPEPPKFTFADFKAGKLAVHCGTAAKAKEFLAYLHGKGIVWMRMIESLVRDDKWDRWKEKTTYYHSEDSINYDVGLVYGEKEDFKEDGIEIIPYNLADLD